MLDVLGVCAIDGPAAACLLREGRVIAAVREDVFTRIPQDRSFPSNAITYCLRAGKIGAPALTAAYFAGTLDARAPREAYREVASGVSSLGRRVASWLGRGATLRDVLARELDPAVRFGQCDSRAAEAAAAYVGSPFSDAVVAVVGEGRAYAALAHAGEIEPLDELPFDGDVLSLFARARRHAGADAICVGGTGARDRAAMGIALQSGRVWMNAAAGGGAAAIGAAILGTQECSSGAATAVKVGSAAVGPAYNAAQIRTFLRSQGIVREETGRDEAPALVAERLAAGARAIWFDGRLDFDEDAAGSRSVLRVASPREPADRRAGEVIAVPAERAAEVFEVEAPCPPIVEARLRPAWRAFLGDAAAVAPIAAEHRGFRALLAALEQRTGCPGVVARPLRVPSGPVACAPHDAWLARERAAASVIALGPYVLDDSLTRTGAAREIEGRPPSPIDPAPSARSTE